MFSSRVSPRLALGLAALVATSAVVLALGHVLDARWLWALLAGFLLALIAWHAGQVRILGRWLGGDGAGVPEVGGVWDEVLALVQGSRRKAAVREAALSDAVARWQEAARALPDGVVILDGDHITWCNGTASEHFRIDAANDAGRPFIHLVRFPEFLAYLEGGDYAKPVVIRPADAPDRVYSVQVVAYGIGQRLVLSRDITRFARLEEVRREFVANVSHEMRTPLTVIVGFLEAIDASTPPEDVKRYFALMSEQARRMQRLVEDLLALSALESSPPPAMEETVPMRALVDRVAADARALSAGRHKIELETNDGPDLVGNESELASAFGNLVSNAVRYTPEGGRVHLRWHGLGDGAAFEVEDSGIGIPAEHIPRLTERFYRVDRGRSRETGGTGLGLAIVKHALGRHGAVLDIRSASGQGSVFSARFSGPRLRARAPLS